MFPWLLRVPIAGVLVGVPTYAVMMAVGVVAGVELSLRAAARSGVSLRPWFRVLATTCIAGLVAARLAHVAVVEPQAYLSDPARLLRVWEGGQVVYGAFLGGAAALVLGARRAGIEPRLAGDLAAPGALLGLALGRLGCFAAGCCYGRPIDWGTGVEWPWGVVFLGGQVPPALRGFPLHPTQLMESVGAALLCVAAWRTLRRPHFPGQVLWTAALGYAVLRALVELLRLDLRRGFVLPHWWGDAVSTSQGISLVVGAVAVWQLARGVRGERARA